MRCMQACSTPPMYWSTGIQLPIFLGSSGSLSFFGSMYRRKYQLDSKKGSKVSVSRLAGPPQDGPGRGAGQGVPLLAGVGQIFGKNHGKVPDGNGDDAA